LAFDYVVIDCPPALGILPINALAAAHAVIIPITATPYANDGLMRTLPSIKFVQEGLNKALLLQGVLFTINDRNKTTRKINQLIRSRLGNTVYRTEIPRDPVVIEAASAGLPVCAYAPRSSAAAAHLDFAYEFLDRHRQTAAKAGVTLDPPQTQDQALAWLGRWRDAHECRLDDSSGESFRRRNALLNLALYGNRTRIGRLHLQMIHFFIDNRLWLMVFLLVTFVLAATTISAGLSGMRMLAVAIGLV